MPGHRVVEAPEPNLGTSISGWVRPVLLAMIALGVDGRRVFRDCGLDPDAQGKALVRNPVAKMQYVWQQAENSIDDRNLLATQIASYLNASSFHALGFGLYASSSLADMFRRLHQYREIISSSVDMEVFETHPAFAFRIIDKRAVQSHLTTVVFILFLLRVCHQLGGPELSPNHIRVRWSEGDYDEAMRRQSSAHIVYDQPWTELSFSRADAYKRLPSAQPQLASFQDRLCHDYLHSLDEHQHLTSRLRIRIIQGLANDRATIDDVAQSLYMSPRTLQRKLKAEQTSFRDVLREARMELAEQYARNADLTATEIAFLLGFGGLAQFTAAFRSWYGVTFTEFRQRLGPAS